MRSDVSFTSPLATFVLPYVDVPLISSRFTEGKLLNVVPYYPATYDLSLNVYSDIREEKKKFERE